MRVCDEVLDKSVIDADSMVLDKEQDPSHIDFEPVGRKQPTGQEAGRRGAARAPHR